MGVSYHSPGMFIIGGILFIAVCVSAFLMRHKPDKSRILRAANTAFQKRDSQKYHHSQGYFPVHRPVFFKL